MNMSWKFSSVIQWWDRVDFSDPNPNPTKNYDSNPDPNPTACHRVDPTTRWHPTNRPDYDPTDPTSHQKRTERIIFHRKTILGLIPNNDLHFESSKPGRGESLKTGGGGNPPVPQSFASASGRRPDKHGIKWTFSEFSRPYFWNFAAKWRHERDTIGTSSRGRRPGVADLGPHLHVWA
jgi:hypothetical protein